MAQFDDAKVDEKVWSSVWGWGFIDKICDPADIYYSIQVCFPNPNEPEVFNDWYDFEGKHAKGALQTLFWGEVKIVTPKRQERRPYPCSMCFDRFHDVDELIAHKKEHHDCGEEQKEKCEACERLEGYKAGSAAFLGNEDIAFLLNQHHTCSKKGEK